MFWTIRPTRTCKLYEYLSIPVFECLLNRQFVLINTLILCLILYYLYIFPNNFIYLAMIVYELRIWFYFITKERPSKKK